MKTVVVGTAGHIDHGKSSLVKALTGTDPDRWEEERRRGITIDLGFAYRKVAGNQATENQATEDLLLDFVDVPGHERFVKNMLAGAGGIDLVLFVIAADESIKPQTREHFDICRLLGVRSGVVALTKCDLVSADALELARLEAEEFFAGSFLQGAPVVPVSVFSGQGIDAILETLTRAGHEAAARDATCPFRLPIDRAFSIKGFGTVVTGTLIAGALEKEMEVEIYPTGRRARIRGLETHGEQVAGVVAGQRTAVNLGGVETSDLARGMTLAAPGRFHPTQRFNASLTMLPGARALKNRAPVHFHCGAAECVAEVVAFADVSLGRYAQLRLREPMLLLPGDRFILRQFSPMTTIGGGVVLDNSAPRYKKSEDPSAFLQLVESGTREQILEAMLERGRFGMEESELLARTGWDALAEAGVVVSERPRVLADRKRFDALLSAMLAEVARFHDANPLQAGITREELRDRLVHGAHPAVFEAALKQAKLETAGEIVRLAGRQIVMNDAEAEAKQEIASAFERSGLIVPAVKEVLDRITMDAARKQRILQILLKERVLVRISADLVFHRAALEWLRELLAQHKAKSSRINVAQFKELTGITRKYAIPLLEYLDREHVTRRAGDERLIL